jgi:hypothetical protein
MKIIISILIILALFILVWNMYRLNGLSNNNIDYVNGKKTNTKFSNNLIRYNLNKKDNYKLDFSVYLNTPISDRSILLNTKNWYVDIFKENLRLVNNNNIVVVFDNTIKSNIKYNMKVIRSKDKVEVLFDDEYRRLDLYDDILDEEIILGGPDFDGKIDLVKEVFEGFYGYNDKEDETYVFVGTDFYEKMNSKERYLTKLKDRNNKIIKGTLYYILHNNKLKMVAVKDDVNKTRIDIREADITDLNNFKETDDELMAKFNYATKKNISSSRFRIEVMLPDITTTSTLIPGSLDGCVLPDSKFRSKTDCITKCLASDNKHCNSKRCQTLCLDCTDELNCPWVVNEVSFNPTIPEAPIIRLIADDRKIVVDWKRPYDGGSEITNYIVIVYEPFNKNAGIIVSEVNNHKCLNCEHTITGLQNQKMYDVCIRAVNAKGLGYLSNIETIAPDGPLESSSISGTLLPSDNEIYKDLKQEMNDYECNQDEYYSLKDYIKNM